MLCVPCGQCIGCRLAKSVDWATRIHHEAQMHDANCFVTLTYGPEHLPRDGSICIRELQLFMKRLRKKLGHNRVRFFGCGEYGDLGRRPHYHVILFGWSPFDTIAWRKTKSGFVVSRSPLLEQVWPYGHVEVGTVTHQSAAYVARYCIKKVNGREADAHYRRVDPETGEVWNVQPEFICMSTKPGIGSAWFSEFAGDAFPSDFVVVDGLKRPVPNYYKRKLDEYDQFEVTTKRMERAAKHADNNTPERLATREESQLLRAERLQRELDTEP